MVDGSGHLRAHWRNLLGAFTTLGEGGVAERGSRLDRAFEEEGVTSVLPGAAADRAAWRCDPVPLPLPAAEFAALEAGLAQRARVLEMVLQDLYGPQSLIDRGLLPPALVFTNPGFVRACHALGATPKHDLLQFYAADLIRCPDGAWRVLADRTAMPSGAGYARENRRILARVMPEAFRPVQVRQLRPFFDAWQEALGRLVDKPNPAVALLTPGVASPQWFEHMFLSRELSCHLVEGGDLTVRDGVVLLKTLRGLQPIDVLLRRVDGRLLDPLELEGDAAGVTGLMDAWRTGRVRIANDPGSGLAEAPALAAFLPQIAMALLGERLSLPSVPTLWLGQAQAKKMVAEDPARWLVRPATDGMTPARVLGEIPEDDRRALLGEIDSRGWDYAATAWMPPSVAPCAGPQGLVPKPVVLRMFLMNDGTRWRAMQGGLARIVDAGARIAGRLPRGGVSKDVWVLNDEGMDLIGPAAATAPPMPIRRTSGELPSRAADNLYWLGRYTERLEDSARLVRSSLTRIGRGAPLPRDVAELAALSRCLLHAGMIEDEAGPLAGRALTEALLRSLRDGGRIARQFARVARLTEAARDRLTGDMYTTFTQSLRLAREQASGDVGDVDSLSQAMIAVLRFAASVAGVMAENMVRGGGWLFLDLGRRIERAQAVAAEVAFALDLPPARIEGGLRLVLELCDSVITYRSPLPDDPAAGAGCSIWSWPTRAIRAAWRSSCTPMHSRLAEIAGPDDPLTRDAEALLTQVGGAGAGRRGCAGAGRRGRGVARPAARDRGRRGGVVRPARPAVFYAAAAAAAARGGGRRHGGAAGCRHEIPGPAHHPLRLPQPGRPREPHGAHHAARPAASERAGNQHRGDPGGPSPDRCARPLRQCRELAVPRPPARQLRGDGGVGGGGGVPAGAGSRCHTALGSRGGPGRQPGGGRVQLRQSDGGGRPGCRDICAEILSAGTGDPDGAARSERTHRAGFCVPRRCQQHPHAGGAHRRAARRRLPGFRPYDDRRAAHARPAGALCVRLYPHATAAWRGATARRRPVACLGRLLARA